MTRIAVFASGEGTNLQSLIDACRAGQVRGEIVLVVSNNAEAGALKRAAKAGIPTLVSAPKDFESPEEYSAHLGAACLRKKVELVCLAGFLLHLKAPLLKAFPWRILNIHPALLPAFGGKGMYGKAVHEAVLRSGARVSGATVHLVDELYDHGWPVCQSAVPVLQGDTPETLSARVRAQEHRLYPKAVALFCEGRLKADAKGLTILPSLDKKDRVRRALLSVSDKAGVVDLARGLSELGVELVSTSGTAKALEEAGLPVRQLEDLTGFPEILGGRVKTLHPRVHGGILMRRQDAAQAREAALHGIEPIDLVVVNLYPFEKTAAKAADAYGPEVIEQIDIGGVALIRAAAKNFEDVAVLTSPSDYAAVLAELVKGHGKLSPATRKRLALAGFRHTAAYDAMIAKAWGGEGAGTAAPRAASPAHGAAQAPSDGFPKELALRLAKVQDLRYGENPHQRAALYVAAEAGRPSFEQIHGKELSYNNLADAAGTWEAACEFEVPAAVIYKHATPSGIGTGRSVLEAFDAAWACDPLSAFGGVMAFNKPVPKEIAERISKRFVEVIIAPAFEPEALALLKVKPNIRLLVRKDPPGRELLLRSLGAEVLVTEPDRQTFGPEWKVVTKRHPGKAEEEALRFGWIACKHVKSNAIVLAGPHATVGIGAGQMSRVDSVHMAGVKYREYLRTGGKPPRALVLASDAFFPFRDGVDAAARLDITAIVQPGGSVKDAEVIAAADEHRLAMVFTGMRHFRH